MDFAFVYGSRYFFLKAFRHIKNTYYNVYPYALYSVLRLLIFGMLIAIQVIILHKHYSFIRMPLCLPPVKKKY